MPALKSLHLIRDVCATILILSTLLLCWSQVVVADESTAKELLEKGQLTKRVTIIPLNKIQV